MGKDSRVAEEKRPCCFPGFNREKDQRLSSAEDGRFSFFEAIQERGRLAMERTNTREDDAERRSRLLAEALSDATLGFLQTGSINDMARLLVDRCAAIAGAPLGFLYDLDANGDARFLAISGQESGEGAHGLLPVSSTRVDAEGFLVIRRTKNLLFAPALEGKTVLAESADTLTDYSRDPPQGLPSIASFLGAPMKAGETIVGVIGLLNKPGGFAEREKNEVEAFARTAALAVHSARTELARQEAIDHLRVVQKFEAIGKLAGGIAHDFNNLLTVINGYSELLLQKMHPGDSNREDIKLILEAGEKAADLIRQLLAFSRQQILEPRVMNLNDLIRDLQQILRCLPRENIETHLSLAEDLGLVKADPGKLEQILINILVNARDAMPAGGSIILSTANVEFDADFVRSHPGSHRGSYVMVAVADTGCGMPEDVKARVFEPFFTTKAPGRGTGLGLSTVYGIVKQSGGYILVESTPGQGSIFRIYLPRA
jgi:signal transduction histidine kinase